MPHVPHENDSQQRERMAAILGYLNFSSGSTDAGFLRNLNAEFAVALENGEAEETPPWQQLRVALLRGLDEVAEGNSAFSDCHQARSVLDLVWHHLAPAYRAFHADLLFHLADEALFRPLMLGRMCEAVLQQGSPWDQAERIADGALRLLNDYVGHRPIPMLQTHRHQAYPHEWVRPVPLYVKDAGIEPGLYHEVLDAAFAILQTTDADILRAAHFDLGLLDELALDPRAFDFEHPANKRPNYHFGQWDPHVIDGSGRFRRFVIQQVTLEAVMDRVNNAGEIPLNEAIFEGGAVLAGTILMATGVCGWGPEAHDSDTTLNTLLPVIAGYRDQFYQRLLKKLDGEHGERLRAEARQRKQPFAACRQALNAALTSRRAAQLSHVQLAQTFARMGYYQSAVRHANIVPATSARMICKIDCLLSTAEQPSLADSDHDVPTLLNEASQTLRDGVECGAIIDPWNILGFDAHYSLFPAIENSVRDFRADELAERMDRFFNIYATAWCNASADDDTATCLRLESDMQSLAEWWHQFAAHEVSTIDAPHGLQAVEAARHAAQALNQWHKAGAEAGDIRFWAPHAAQFGSANAYVMVIDALIDHGDFVASMALLVHWLSQSDQVGLERGVGDFSLTATRWMKEVLLHCSREEAWSLTRKLFERLEANADTLGEAPQFEIGDTFRQETSPDDVEGDLPLDDDDSLFDAAYEGVVFRDSTDDGMEGSVFDFDQSTSDELERETHRIHLRLNYLICLAHLWSLVSTEQFEGVEGENRLPSLSAWAKQAERLSEGLDRLSQQITAYHLATPSNETEAMIDFDRRRSLQEAIAERVMTARVRVSTACLMLCSAQQAADASATLDSDCWGGEQQPFINAAIRVLGCILNQDRAGAAEAFDDFVAAADDIPLLYVPVARGGDPQAIVAARLNQRIFQMLASQLPRLGLLVETRRLLDVARQLERDNNVGAGAVTEYDDLFGTGLHAMVECVIDSSESWQPRETQEGESSDETLIGFLEQLTQSMIDSWLSHSRTLRLSVLERVNDEERWNRLVKFIKKYGKDLFSQQFLNLGNLRAISHQGVDHWVREVEGVPYLADQFKLFGDLETKIPRRTAVRYLSLVVDAIIENYVEYRDYNATTTQSDRGECLYMLLDFIRLRVQYDRIAWNLRPVVLTHELLVRRGRNQAAQMWQRALSERFTKEADQFQQRQKRLEKKYAMKMPTVADRLAERFVLPMTIDRLCALVEPAIEEATTEGEKTSFNLLEKEANVLVDELSGVGLDLPNWLVALDDEVHKVVHPDEHACEHFKPGKSVPQTCLSRQQLAEIFSEWE